MREFAMKFARLSRVSCSGFTAQTISLILRVRFARRLADLAEMGRGVVLLVYGLAGRFAQHDDPRQAATEVVVNVSGDPAALLFERPLPLACFQLPMPPAAPRF
ncbi:MAG: hypothetical protein WDM96_19925 [Lacunisphaera sp.]